MFLVFGPNLKVPIKDPYKKSLHVPLGPTDSTMVGGRTLASAFPSGMSIRQSVRPTVRLTVRPTVCPSHHPSVRQSDHPTIHPTIRLSHYPTVRTW